MIELCVFCLFIDQMFVFEEHVFQEQFSLQENKSVVKLYDVRKTDSSCVSMAPRLVQNLNKNKAYSI